ncbi:MAG: DUF1553 domain-containing protein, partial [Planctomycetales bacterium]|nr:DUF1553 domain-containing protein [Planctomycetales bacterium]
TEDRNYPDAYKYRRWVIDSFNNDRPYDEFIRLQLAADHLVVDETSSDLDATGFLTLGRRFLNNPHDIIDDRIDVVTRGLMGLTVTCARCHEHKYDPIPMADYYSLYGVFDSSQTTDKQSIRLVDVDRPHDAHLLVRGNPANRGDRVPRRFLAFLTGPEPEPFQRGSGRLELAAAIASADNPLTARVFVNRIWGHLMGTHLVETPSDFGVRCDAPAQPEALDYLAVRFVDSGWSMKHLVRMIVTSSVYRQASESTLTDGSGAQHPHPNVAIDQENRLFWRMNPRRVDFESLRDAMLAVSGELQLEPVGGPSVQIEQVPSPPQRTVYAFIDRQNLPGLFRTFDFAGPDTHAPKRPNTAVPQQPLYLMNSQFVLATAEAIATRVSVEQCADIDLAIEKIYASVLQRSPTQREMELARNYVETGQAETGQAGSESEQAMGETGPQARSLDIWARLAQVLVMSNEFATID